jgi:hypothetical protein
MAPLRLRIFSDKTMSKLVEKKSPVQIENIFQNLSPFPNAKNTGFWPEYSTPSSSFAPPEGFMLPPVPGPMYGDNQACMGCAQ